MTHDPRGGKDLYCIYITTSHTIRSKPFKVTYMIKQNVRHINSLEERARSSSLVSSAERLVGRLVDTVRQLEGDFRVNELEDVGTLAVVALDDGGLDDLDAGATSPVTGSHLGVHLLNSGGEGGVTVFLVHIVGTRSGVVSDPETEVLDVVGVLFVDLVNVDDLTVSLLNLLKLGHVVPETRTSNHAVGSEDSHSENLRLLELRRNFTSVNRERERETMVGEDG